MDAEMCLFVVWSVGDWLWTVWRLSNERICVKALLKCWRIIFAFCGWGCDC